VSVAVTDETSACGRFEHRGLEDPEVLLGLTQWKHRLGMDALAVTPLRQLQQVAVRDVTRRENSIRHSPYLCLLMNARRMRSRVDEFW